MIGFKTVSKCISQSQVTMFRREIPAFFSSKSDLKPLLIAYNHTERSRIQQLMDWKDGSEFEYYDFWRNGIDMIGTENINDDSKIYLTTMKAKELKRHGFLKESHR